VGRPAYLGDDFGIGLQLQEALREPGGVGLVVGLGEDADRTPQCYLHVRRLQLTLREVRCQLEVSADVIGFFFCNSSALKFDRHAK
jgi:hypothetical protein